MMRRLAIAALSLLFAGLLSAAELRGKVVHVQKDAFHVQLESKEAPSLGDKVEVSLEIPGLTDRALVGAGKVAEIRDGLIVVTIERAPGKIEKDQLALVFSEPKAKLDTTKTDTAYVSPLKKLREAAFRTQSSNNLKELGMAWVFYESIHRQTVPPAIVSKDGKPLLSWRVALLPLLEQGELHRQFKLDESWDSDHNKTLLPLMPKVYAPPGMPTAEKHVTFYQAFAGKGAAFEPFRPLRIADFRDGLASTMIIAEGATPVPWTKPEDMPYDSAKPIPKMGGMFTDGFHALFADARVLYLRNNLPEPVLRALITRDGGEARPKDEEILATMK